MTDPTTSLPLPARVSTGIPGLDNVLAGGLPENHLYLVEGEPGSGKTTLGLQFLLDGASRGEAALYVTLAETADELRTVGASHGWSLDALHLFELVSANGLSGDAEQSILHPSEVELGETTRGVMAEVERLAPARVVFDSLSEMRLLAQDPLRYRRQILALKHFFKAHVCTVLLLDDKSSTSGDQQLHSVVHGVINLSRCVSEYGEDKRFMRVVKLRGVKFRGGEHDFKLDTGGISVYPRLIAAEHPGPHTSAVASTGVATLDAMLGGGLGYGSNTLFAGASGVGKTTTALTCVHAALVRGEKAAFYLFDEGKTSVLARCATLGIDLQPFIDNGQLDLMPLDPAAVTPGEFADMVQRAVEADGVRVLCIDSINTYLHAMPGGKFLMLQVHELQNYLNQRGVMTILVLGQHGIFADSDSDSDIDLSYLSDCIVQFRYFEARGSLLKAVSVIKCRTSVHELTVREFHMGANGIQLGAALTDFEGLMRGVPTYHGSLALLGNSPAVPGL